jgi:hypothetical protein
MQGEAEGAPVARALPDGDEADEMINAALKSAVDLLSQ